jgi:hypothetical protein
MFIRLKGSHGSLNDRDDEKKCRRIGKISENILVLARELGVLTDLRKELTSPNTDYLLRGLNDYIDYYEKNPSVLNEEE